MKYIYHPFFAQAYSEGTYGSCGYSETTANCVPPSGSLSNTGVLVIGIVSVACAVIMISIVVRFWRRARRERMQTQEIQVEEIDARSDRDDDQL